MPLMAPALFIRLEKIPMTIAGKNELAASPKANATTCPTNPGGLMPKYPAIQTATPAAMRAAVNSCFSDNPRAMLPLSKSCATAVEITNNRPAAVDNAAANPPAATNPTTQFGSFAISGFANTMMSGSIVSSFATSDFSPRYWMRPSPFKSLNSINSVASQFLNHSGTSSYLTSANSPSCSNLTVWRRLVRANTATAGAVV